MSLSEFLARVRSRVEAGVPASLAVEELFEPASLAPEALAELARYGAISMANDGAHTLRRTLSRVARTDGPTQAEKVAGLLRRVRLQAADGSVRSLWEFTAEDWRGLEAESRAQSRGWSRRAKLAKETAALMEQHGAETTHHLPTHLIAQVTQEVAETW